MMLARHALFLTLCCLFSALLLSACASSKAPTSAPVPNDVVATFAGEALTFEELRTRYARSSGTVEEDELASYDEYRDFLNRYVDFRLKVLDARALGLDDDSTTVAELDNYRRQLARPYLVERQVLDSLILDLYEKQAIEIKGGHILTSAPPDATVEDTLRAYEKIWALYDSLNAGAPFEDLAARHSEDPSAVQNRGVLGYFTGGRLIYRFEDRAYATPVGSYSEPFRTQFGYHIVKVYDRRPYSPTAVASHILIGTQDKSPEEALDMAESLRQRILDGEDFAEIARVYSNDPGSADQGGELGPIGRGRTVQPFEEALFGLSEPGQISEPVRTQFGYHLIRLEERAERPSFDDSYNQLKGLVNRLPRLRESEQLMGRKYRMQLGSSVDSLALESALSKFPEDSLYLKFRGSSPDSTTRATTFASIAGTSYTLGDLHQYTRTARPQRIPTSYEEFYDVVDGFLDFRAVDVAADRLEELNPEFRDLMREYEEGILLFAVSEDSVWNAASRDTTALEALYESRKSTLTFPERKRVVSLTTAVDSVLEDAAGMFEQGRGVAAVLESMQEAPADLRIDTTFVADTTNSVYDNVLALAPGEYYGPQPFQNRSILLYVDGDEAPRTKTFAEARAELVSMYQEELEQRWVERLRDRYEATLYPDHLRASLERHAGRAPSTSDSP